MNSMGGYNLSRSQKLYIFLLVTLSCLVHNTYGDAPPDIRLFTLLAGGGNTESGVTVLENSSLTVLQSVKGEPTPTVTFYRNGEVFSSPRDAVLRIARVTRETAGLFWMVANNSLGAAISNKYRLEVYFFEQWTDSSDISKVRVNSGDALKLDVPPLNANPPPDRDIITWLYATSLQINSPINRVNENENVYITESAQLIVLDLESYYDGRAFRANYTNLYTSDKTSSKVFEVEVTDTGRTTIAPEFVISLPAESLVEEGSTLELVCVVNAKPKSAITWWRIPAGGGPRQRFNNGRLSRNARENSINNVVNGEKYQCESGTGGQTIVSETTVIVTQLRFQQRLHSRYNTDLGSSQQLPCSVTSNPPANFTWYKNAVAIVPQDRLIVSPNGTLTIIDAQLSDAGVYQCMATNKERTISDQTYLRLNSYPPVFTRQPENQTLLTGGGVSISCHVDGQPTPSIYWKFKSQPGVGNENKELSHGGRYAITPNSLNIATTTWKDSGVYTCKANNSLAVTQASAHVSVYNRTSIRQERYTPEESKSSRVARSCMLNKDSRITAQVLWFKDDVLISANQFRSLENGNQTLRFKSLRPLSDEGTFTCKVFSDAGNATKSYNIIVISVPDEPTVTGVSLASAPRTVTITWKKGFDGNKPILNYIVKSGKPGDRPEDFVTLSDSIAPDQRSYDAGGLTPSSSYQFLVSAVNSIGEGNPSARTQVVTIPAEAPSAPPGNVQAVPRGPNSIEVSFTPPPKDEWNSERLHGYMVEHRGAESGAALGVTFYNTSVEGIIRVTITDLLPNTPYWVRVAAFNEVPTDNPVYSRPLTKVTTAEGQPQKEPEFLSAVPVSSTGCRLRWKNPDPRTIQGRVVGYNLTAYKGDEETKAASRVVPATHDDVQEADIAKLAKYTRYRVTVNLYTRAGSSPPATLYCKTKEDTPEAVTSLAIPDIHRLHNSLTVTWDPPTITNGVLKYYVVTVSGEGITSLNNLYNISHPQANVTISQLSPDSEYTVSVRAATNVGPGPSSTKSASTRRPPQRPDKPTDARVSDIESRSVVLSFIAGYNGESPITKYMVEYRNSERQDWTHIVDFKTADIQVELKRTLLPPITGLLPYTEYYFRIFAVNVAGLSYNASDSTAVITTLMAPPEGPPTNVSMRAQNHSTLIINWAPLDKDLFHGASPGYTINYQSEYDTEVQTASVSNPSSRFHILGNLKAYTTYTVNLVSRNNEYTSDMASNNASATTIEYVPSRAPTFRSNVSLLPSHLNIVWDPVQPKYANGMVLGYHVSYKPHGSSDEEKLKDTEGSSVDISGLIGNTVYAIRVAAFTRVGSGNWSAPLLARTKKGKPGPPRSLAVQNIQSTSFTLTWLPPLHSNSDSAVKYTLVYKRTDGGGLASDVSNISSTFYEVDDITAGVEYTYRLQAINSFGDSSNVSLRFTATPPAGHGIPNAPLNLEVETIRARSVGLKWQIPSGNGLPVRNYTLFYRPESGEGVVSEEFIGGQSQQFTLTGLQPDTKYFFKLAAMNDKGQSPVTSEVEQKTRTDVPTSPPLNLQVVPITATSLNITWQTANSRTWNGQLTSTRIWYKKYKADAQPSTDIFLHKDVEFPTSSAMLVGLEAGNLYEIRLSSKNSNGTSEKSAPTIIYVGVAVPVGVPSKVGSMAVSDREITISWNKVSEHEINGQLLGYKVYYRVIGEPEARRKRDVHDSTDMEYDLVGPEKTSHTIQDLQTFKKYEISVTAYNIAGEGPKSLAIVVETDEGFPGPPDSLSVEELTLTSVNVTWDTPAEPNGVILRYLVRFYPHDAKPDESGVVQSTSLYVNHPTTFTVDGKLSRNTTYNLTVYAFTSEGEGAPSSLSFTTGPRPGVPSAPSKAEYSIEDNGVLIKWKPGDSGDGPVEGYLIEGKDDVQVDDGWKFLLREADGSAEKVLLPTSLLDDRTYTGYRVSLFNKKGLGVDKVAEKTTPIYKTWWFLVIIGLAALVIIIIVTAILCCYCYRTRAKLAEEAYEQDVIGADTGYNTYEMRQSFKRDNRRTSNKYRAEPPRPSPGAVLYSADEPPPNYDDSSVTEKGDMSSDDDETKGHASGTDSSDDDIDKAGASSVNTSYNNYQYRGYNPYVQSGAVQQSWQNSFGRGRNQLSMYAYTDSEAESSIAPSTSHYRSTNGLLNDPHHQRNGGRQNHMHSSPDIPGSRTPLPNFTSFV